MDATNLRVTVLGSRFNGFITEALVKGAVQVLTERGCSEENLRVVSVPGAWELPIAASSLALSCDAIVAVGAVVRGETPHFDYVAEAAAEGLRRVMLDTGVPIAFGVLTTDTMQQAMDRAGGSSGNKGAEAAEAAIEMANSQAPARGNSIMAARHRSRKRALQVLFEWDVRGESIDGAIAHYYDTLYSEESEAKPKQDKFMEELARGTAAAAPEIDRKIQSKAAHWRLERMPVVDRNIIRLAIFEMTQQTVPAPVVIDEAIELARQFSNDDAIPFINGVLDAVHRQEFAAGHS